MAPAGLGVGTPSLSMAGAFTVSRASRSVLYVACPRTGVAAPASSGDLFWCARRRGFRTCARDAPTRLSSDSDGSWREDSVKGERRRYCRTLEIGSLYISFLEFQFFKAVGIHDYKL